MPKKRILIIVAIVLVLIAAGAALYMNRHKTVKTVNGKKGVVVYSTDHPSEEPIKKSEYKSSAGPTEPKYITLPTIKAEGFVEKVGVDQNTQIAVPTNINLAGWYTEALAPGQAGLSIIDGHLDGYKHDGIFKNLEKLKTDQTYVIERGDGKRLTYKVKTVTSVPTDQAATKLFTHDPAIKSQLNLITCGGTFNKDKKQYENRVIVVSELQ